jgi:cytochrome c biogenesis protein CcdA
MNEIFLGIGGALWLGILTSISPCPLSTNIAAISYVGRHLKKAHGVLVSGLLYATGRCLAYLIVAILVTKGLFSVPGVSIFLQKYMNLFIGPMMVIVGVVLLDLFRFSFGFPGFGKNWKTKVDNMGVWGAGALGLVFALSFCPTSAGLFFGGLIPLALKGNSTILLPILYGIGTALPVIGFSFVLAFGAHTVGTVFNKLTIIEIWVRRITAALMILIGIVLILKHNFGLYFGI